MAKGLPRGWQRKLYNRAASSAVILSNFLTDIQKSKMATQPDKNEEKKEEGALSDIEDYYDKERIQRVREKESQEASRKKEC